MPEIAYVGPHDAVVFHGVTCERNEMVTFPKQVAAEALEQACWASAPLGDDELPGGVVDYEALAEERALLADRDDDNGGDA